MPINVRRRKSSLSFSQTDKADLTPPPKETKFTVRVSLQQLDEYLIKKCCKRTKDWDLSTRAGAIPGKPERCQPFYTFGLKPNGALGIHPGLECKFAVAPADEWYQMPRFDRFRMIVPVKKGMSGLPRATDFRVGMFIWVANEHASKVDIDNVQRHIQTPGKALNEYGWIGMILEIRARDAQNIFLRLVWMYWPDDLQGGKDFGRTKGRQIYHGRCELIASNHMDIINAITVSAVAQVSHWREGHEEEQHRSLYWRQALDIRTQTLSTLDPKCICQVPENPDRHLIGCCNPDCFKWLHDECLIDHALTRVWARLGPETPQAEVDGVLDVESEDAESRSQSMTRRRLKKKKPWVGYFSGRLVRAVNSETNVVSNTPLVEVTDLRNLEEGMKVWAQKIRCLICNMMIEEEGEQIDQ